MPSKQTKRERKELAKKARLEAMKRAQRRRRMRRVMNIVIALVVIGALVGIVLWNSSRSEQQREEANASITKAAAALGCEAEVERFPQEGREHVAPPTQVTYNTNPPTSGNHYGGPGATGVLTATPEDEPYVHNLEHGHVGIWYEPDAVSEPALEALESYVDDNDRWVFMAPRSGMNAQLTLTAWQHMLKCETVSGDPEEFTALARAWRERFADKGLAPENIPGSPR